MLLVFTYYNASVSNTFIQSMKSVAANINHTPESALIILTDQIVPRKILAEVDKLFNSISISEPKQFLEERKSIQYVNSINFMEVLLLYPDYDRLYIDPNIVIVNQISIPKDTSLFFKQHTGIISTKLAFLKSGQQFATAFSTINNNGQFKLITDQLFTYVISNNFLIQKKLDTKHILSGKLFNASQLTDIPTSNIIAVDMTDSTQTGERVISAIHKITTKQKPIVLTTIRKKSEPINLITSIKNSVNTTPVVTKIAPNNRHTLDRIFEEVDRLSNNYTQLTEFTNPSLLTIIIPVYKNAPVLAICLESIMISTHGKYNLLVINDSPFDSEVDELGNKFGVLLNQANPYAQYVFLTNSENLGFIKTVNLGLSMATGDVILLNSDTIVSDSWTTRMLEHKASGKIASVTPLSNSAAQCSFPIQDINQTHYRDLKPELIDKVFSRLSVDCGQNSSTGIGFCMLMTQEALSEIGKFDDINFTLGYGEENDWCWRAVLAGYKNIIAPNIYVAHEHGTSFASVKNLAEVRMKNKNALVAKHPNYFSLISKYDNTQLSQLYQLLKYAIGYEYSRPIKKPVKLILGNSDLSEIQHSDTSLIRIVINNESFEVTSNDFMLKKTISFVRGENLIKFFIQLIDPSSVLVTDKSYLQIQEIKEQVKRISTKPVNSSIVVELPMYDTNSGGINRMKKLVLELPRYSATSGGILETLKLKNSLSKTYTAVARFQRLTEPVPMYFTNYTVGLPNSSFPSCDACITYSDTPYMSDLVALPQVKKVLIYMLSYGMSIDRERKNVKTPGVVVLCSTKKLEKAISADGVKVHRVGFAIEMNDMYVDENIERKNYLAIMYHPANDKRYTTAITIANDLYRRKKIDGVITFGTEYGYDTAMKPNGLIKHYSNANRTDIRKIFNSCKCFLMPSITEGLNLTPIESTLCGCPAVLVDGAIDEIFFDKQNCRIAESDNISDLLMYTLWVLDNFETCSIQFKTKMQTIISKYTWDKVVKNIMSHIC